jgi:hypothetical protein
MGSLTKLSLVGTAHQPHIGDTSTLPILYERDFFVGASHVVRNRHYSMG